MLIGAAQVTFRLDWAHSLKEKRMCAQSLITRTQNKFHISVAEVADQDVHDVLTLGICCVANEAKFVQQVLERVRQFMEENTDAEMILWDSDVISF